MVAIGDFSDKNPAARCILSGARPPPAASDQLIWCAKWTEPQPWPRAGTSDQLLHLLQRGGPRAGFNGFYDQEMIGIVTFNSILSVCILKFIKVPPTSSLMGGSSVLIKYFYCYPLSDKLDLMGRGM